MSEPRTGSLPWLTVAVVAVVVNLPLVHSTLSGERPAALLVLITLVADAALVAVVTLRRFAPPPED